MTSHYYSQYNTFNSRSSNLNFLCDPWVGKVVCKNYKIIRKINEGSFGKIYKAVHQIKGDFYAVKIENKDKKKDEETLLLEAQILYSLKGEKGFPRMYFFVQDGESRTMVETLLGPNLDELFSKCNKKFSLKTVLLFLDQALNRLEFLHKQQYIHRDIKPENFLIGATPDDDTIYLIDFGLAMKYTDVNGKHIKQKKGQPMVGTARFTPICSHRGMTQNRASDLESLGYLAVFFLKGSLPWMNIDAKTREERFQLIGQRKMVMATETLCDGLRQEFVTFFNYIFNIAFDQEPSYPYIRKLFRKLFVECNFQNDQKLDWHLMNDQQGAKTTLTERISRKNSMQFFEEVIVEQNSSDEHDRDRQQSLLPSQMIESKNSSNKMKRDSWMKSASMKPPVILSMVDSKGSRLKKKCSHIIEQQQDEQPMQERQMMLEVMMNRKVQHNSLLSRQTDFEPSEDMRHEDGHEYHPYPTLAHKMDILNLILLIKRIPS